MLQDTLQDIWESTPTVLASAARTSTGPIPSVIPDLPEIEKIHKTGRVTLWVTFVLLVLGAASFAALSWRVPISRRINHTITTTVAIVGALTYFALASGHGVTFVLNAIREHHEHVPDTFVRIFRQVFWARWVDWLITQPLLIIQVGILSGLSGGHIVLAVLASITSTLTGLFSAFGHEETPQKWGWYTVAAVSYLVVAWHLLLNGRAAAFARSAKIGKIYSSFSLYLLIVWLVYPIAWAVSHGSHNWSVDSEIIAYTVLDLLVKVVFGAWVLTTNAKVPETNVELTGFWAHGIEGEGAVRLGDDGP